MGESERTVFVFCSPTSIKRTHEMKNSCCSCATKAKEYTKRCGARAKLLFCQSKPIPFPPFLLPLSSSLFKLPIELFPGDL